MVRRGQCVAYSTGAPEPGIIFIAKRIQPRLWHQTPDAGRIEKDVVIMHPGPINRGREISSEVADSQRSVILNQVENGIAVRMAVLEKVLNGVAGN